MIETLSMPWSKALLALIILLGIVVFVSRLVTILRLVAAGRAEDRLDHFWTRLGRALVYIFGQTRVLRNRVMGIAHLAIFYGFIVISFSTVSMVWRELGGGSFLPFITESTLFAWLLQVLAVLVIVAVLVSAVRRYLVHPPEVHNTFGAALVLALIFLLMATLLLTEAAQQFLGATGNATPISRGVAALMGGLDRGQVAGVGVSASWLHILLVVAFLVYIPFSKHMHIIVSPFNQFLRSLRPKGELSTVNTDSAKPLGAGRFEEFQWKQLADLFSCTECGRCLQFCPAHISGRPLAPRQMILDLRHGLLAPGRHRDAGQGNSAPVADAIGRDAVWACVTCRACQEHCPVLVEHIDKIVEARRFLLESEGASPALSKALEGLALLGNPQMQPPGERADFLKKLDIPLVTAGSDYEVVLWLGCAGTYETAPQDTTKALVKVLKAAGVSFAALGEAERCCGDAARRVGEEGLFQELARQNVESLRRNGVKKLLTSCPHCYNTLKNEYPRFGAGIEVVHHADFILGLVRDKRITLDRPLNQAVTYHDPCYLGRYNDNYEAPREILRLTTTGGFREMERTRERALCCGGGGGQMYLESVAGVRVNRLRFAEVEGLDVPLLATACPFCKIMMTDASQYDAAGQRVRVKDISELVAEAMAVPG